MFRLRRKMISEEGPGWAVTGYEDRPLPGRWATEGDATHEGLLGVYLLSGVDVVQIQVQWRRTLLSKGWWQVYGLGELRHTIYGTVEKVYGGWYASTGKDGRTVSTLTEGAQWCADQYKPEKGSKS